MAVPIGCVLPSTFIFFEFAQYKVAIVLYSERSQILSKITTDKIETVGVVGAGPGGLAALYEFLHLDKNGRSTVGASPAADPRFQVTVFEQKSKAGGIWAPSQESDLAFPPREILKEQDEYGYLDPDVIHPQQPIPEAATDATFKAPYVVEGTPLLDQLEWKRSGVFNDLFTNIPSRFTRFLYMPNEDRYHDKGRKIYPFLTQGELLKRFEEFIANEGLAPYIRFNLRVEAVAKDARTNKWIVTVRQTVRGPTKIEEHWYTQQFDAVVIANGHYTVPSFPRIAGLADYNRRHPGTLIHAKAYRDPSIFAKKKVLVVGGSISTVNLLQYVYPVAKRTVLSKRGPHLVFPWINKALQAEGIVQKPTITEVVGDEFRFSDGSVESGFDIVLFTTGYHYHYPFLKNYLDVVDPSNLSRVAGLYRDTFAIEDPTLAITGVAILGVNFHLIEASAAAIAGVWSGFGKSPLPSKEQQRQWSDYKVATVGNNLFYHYYVHNQIKEEFIDPLYEYAPAGRYNPIEADWEHIGEISESMAYLERLYYGLKEGRLSIEDTV